MSIEGGSMLLERPSEWKSERLKTEKGQAFFFSGAKGRTRDIRAAARGLEDIFGHGNVTAYGSALFADKPSRDRFVHMGEQLKKSIESGKTMILAHSFGAAELSAAFDEIEKTDPTFFQQEKNIQNLNIKLISPAGIFTNRREGAKYLAKYGLLGAQEAGMLKRTLPGKTSILEGIVSVSAIPPENIPYDKLAKGVRSASRKLSQFNRSDSRVEIPGERNYLAVFDEKSRKRIERVDAKLEDAIANKSEWSVRRALKKRGRSTRRPIQKVMRGEYSDAFSDPQLSAVGYEKDKAVKRQVRRLFKDTFFRGKVRRRMHDLIQVGGNVEVYLPEQDILLTKKDVQKKLPGASVSIVSLSTHSSPWSIQPEVIKRVAQAA